MTSEAPIRRRNAAATREAILKSARTAFAQSGYDGVGVREIAKGAGVTAMLINRYFGSKEQLFAEVVADSMTAPVILSQENLAAGDFAATMTQALIELTKPEAPTLDGFMLMFHSASSPGAAEISREQIERHHHRSMTGALSGDHAPERAALLLAIVAGVQVMRQMIGLKALTEVEPETLRALIEPMVRGLVDGE